jgi:hypothetical protein
VGLTTFWPLSQKPKIGDLRNDAEGDFSQTFGLHHLPLKSPYGVRPFCRQNGHPKLLNVPLYSRATALLVLCGHAPLPGVLLRWETTESKIRGQMGTKCDSRDGQMGINLQLVDVIYPCSEG